MTDIPHHTQDPPRATSAAPPDSPINTLPSQLESILASSTRLARLQLGIWLHGMKSALLRLAVIAVLSLLALLLVISAIPFLYTGVYHLLTDIFHIPTAWALLIFTAAHLALAAAIGITIIFIAKGSKPPGDTQ